jgi:predicted dehydrogenase
MPNDEGGSDMTTPRHRVLVIGTGSIGERHVRCFRLTGRCDVGIVETRRDLLRRIAGQYGVGAAFDSIEAALDERHWDAAVIATPAPTHVPIALRLASRGLHLLTEKPLAITLEGVADLAAAVERAGLVAGVAYVYRAHPLARRMHKLIRSGRFGDPLQLYVTAGQHFPTYRPAYREIYYADRSSGGGAIQDALTHLLNLGEWLIGPIDRLAADAAHLALDGVTVEDTVHLIARQGPALASYCLNQHQAPNETVITAVCRAGTLRLHLQQGQLTSMRETGAQAWTVELDATLERDAWFTAQADAFLDAVERHVPVLCTIDEAAQTLRVVLAALACLDTGSPLRDVRQAEQRAGVPG